MLTRNRTIASSYVLYCTWYVSTNPRFGRPRIFGSISVGQTLAQGRRRGQCQGSSGTRDAHSFPISPGCLVCKSLHLILLSFLDLFDQKMAFSIQQFDARRVKSYLFRLPLCTRLLLVIIVAFYIASLFLSWFTPWAALIPSEIGLQSSMTILQSSLYHVLT